eukprot:scaffold38356_cov47-Prasinocladus_malaysianus.AAC.1
MAQETEPEMAQDTEPASMRNELASSMACLPAARSVLPSLPSSHQALENGHKSTAPCTWAEAFAFVHARLEAKRKKELKRTESRGKPTVKPPSGPAPGTRFSGEQEKNAFWLITG